ncbi:MAG: hypothetical protein IKZ82_11880, partial [Clostridia bacterium]|nr:hypothetical protein [Clostridia bacterium]
AYSDAEEILNKLTEFLKEKKYDKKIEYVVNTGDFIDQRAIAASIIGNLREKYHEFDSFVATWENELLNKRNDEEYKKEHYLNYTRICVKQIEEMGGKIRDDYNSELTIACEALFEKTGNLFSTFIKNIGVQPENTIVSCGNHDRTWLIGDEDVKCSDSKLTLNFQDRFTLFRSFCDKNGFTYLGTDTPIHETADGCLAFCGFDSVSPSPNTNERYCCGCHNIDYESIFKLSCDTHIIFVSHKPIDDYCDEAKTVYDKARKHTFRHFLRTHGTCVLNGDKHGFANEDNAVLCGAPLKKDSDQIRYTIIDTNSVPWNHIPILFDCGEWKKDNWPELIEDMYAVSKKSILDNQTKNLHNDRMLTSAYDIINHYDKSITEQLSTVFKAECEYRIKGDRTRKVDLWSGDNSIFDFLYEKISKSQFCNPFNIRGEPGSGKSTLLIELYSFFLNKVYNGNTQILPLYFNFRSYFTANEHVGTEKLIKVAMNAFDAFTSEADDLKDHLLAEKKEYKLLYLIDGLDELNFYGNDGIILHKHIHTKCKAIEKDEDLFVLSINQYKKSCTITMLNWRLQTDSDVMYLDPVCLVPISETEKDKRDGFFTAVNTILRDYGIKEVNALSLTKCGQVTADIGLVYYLFCNQNPNMRMKQGVPRIPDKWYQVIRYYKCVLLQTNWDKLDDAEKDSLMKSAYEYLTLDNFDYSTPSCSSCKTKDFKLIISNKSIRNMLCAEYFAELFERIKINEWKPFMTHELGLFICAALYERFAPSAPNQIKRFLDLCEQNEKVTDSAQIRSILIYVLGQLLSKDIDENHRNRLITTLLGSSKKLTPFDYHCLKRSFRIARVYIDSEIHLSQQGKELNSLLSDIVFQKEIVEYDRAFLLTYYGDAAQNYKSSEMLVECEYSEGFDFELVFRNLNSLLDNENNPVYLYNAFMLASFVKSRLMVKSYLNGRRLTHPFFYNEEYDSQEIERIVAVLSIVINRIDIANERIRIISDIRLRAAYKSLMLEMKQLFLDCKDEFNKCDVSSKCQDKLHEDIALRAHPEYAFDKLRKLEYFGRSCWDYNKPPKDTDKNEEDKILDNNINPKDDSNGQHKETVLEHVYEMMLIAFLYLPENAPADYPEYNKRDILSIILTHEFGVAEYGDIPKGARRFVEPNTEPVDYIFSLWCNMCMNTTSSRKDFDLAYTYKTDSKDSENRNINIRIAREIGSIQREYKARLIISTDPTYKDALKWIPEPNKADMTAYAQSIYELLIETNPRVCKVERR